MAAPGSELLLVALGGAHGLNPGMGWLLAVALGLQEGRAGAVWRALPALAAGHAISVGAVLGAAAAVGAVVPPGVLRALTAAALAGFGLFRLVVNRHPRWGGMRVGNRDLVVWSFLMATGHGAGLMVVPLVSPATGHPSHHAAMLPAPFGAAVLHAGGYLAVTALMAAAVYHRAGLRLLRTAWINLDVIWGGALLATAVAVGVTG